MDYQVFVEERRAQNISDLEIAAQWWDHLADTEENSISGQKRIKVYRRTAKALRIQDKTGVAVCSCCHKPFGSHQ